MGKLIEIKDIVLHCDNCHFEVPIKTENISNLEAGTKCPKCKYVMIISRDIEALNFCLKFIKVINFLFGWMVIFSNPTTTSIIVTCKDGEVTIDNHE